jgi:hypothetical protein
MRERSGDLAQRAKRTGIVFSCLKEWFCDRCVLRMVSAKDRISNLEDAANRLKAHAASLGSTTIWSDNGRDAVETKLHLA